MPSVWHGRNRVETTRSPFSVCAPSLSLCCVGDSLFSLVSVSVSASVFLHVLIVTRRSIRARARAGGLGGLVGSCSPMLGAGSWTGTHNTTHTDKARARAHTHTHKLAQACLLFLFLFLVLCRDGRVEAPRRGGGDWRRSESRLEARLRRRGVLRLLLDSLALRPVACV